MVEASTVQVTDAAVLRPGDTLIVAVSHQATAAQIAALHDGIVERFPALGGVVVLNAQQLLVYRPGGGGDE